MDWLPGLELWAGRIGAVAGLATLAVALWGFWRGRHRTAGRETGVAHRALRWPRSSRRNGMLTQLRFQPGFRA